MIFHLVNVSRAACGAMALLEYGQELPNSLASTERRLITNTYADLQVAGDDDNKSRLFFNLVTGRIDHRVFTRR